MKKLLIVLGMLTCLFGMTACGKSDDAVSIPLMTEDEAKQTAEQLINQIDQIVSEGMADYYASDASATEIFDGWSSAMEEMGEYQSVKSYDVSMDDDSVTIVAGIEGTERDGEVTIVLAYENGQMNLSSVTTTVKRTMGELMKNAALNTVLGMGTVFAVLVLIMFIISAFKIIYNLQQKPKKEKAEIETGKAVDNTIAQIIENEELSDDTELVAVIAAAIAASEGAASTDGFVVRSIRRAGTNKWQRA